MKGIEIMSQTIIPRRPKTKSIIKIQNQMDETYQ
jgi:hypothetical protein